MARSFAKASLVLLALSVSTLAQSSTTSSASTNASNEPEPEASTATTTTFDPSNQYTVQCTAPEDATIPATYTLTVNKYKCKTDCALAEYGPQVYGQCCSDCHALYNKDAGLMAICEGCNDDGTKGNNCTTTPCGGTAQDIVDYAMSHQVQAGRRLLDQNPMEMAFDSRALQTADHDFNATCQTGSQSADKLITPVVVDFNCQPCVDTKALNVIRPCCNKCAEIRDREEANMTGGFKRFVQCRGCYGYPGLTPAHEARDFNQLIKNFVLQEVGELHNIPDTSRGVRSAMASAFGVVTIAIYAL